MMTFTTANLCDKHAKEEHFQIAEPILKSFGGKTKFCGQVTTLKVFEDCVLVRKTLEEKVDQRILVIDGGGSHRCALLGSSLAEKASANGWQGIIIYGCIRDSTRIYTLPIGVFALHTHPLKSHHRGHGDRDMLVTFAGINFKKDCYLYADEDGIIVSEARLG